MTAPRPRTEPHAGAARSAAPSVSPELVRRLAEAMGVPLAAGRAEALAPGIQGMFAFTNELNEVDTSDAMPATLYAISEAEA